MAGGAVVARHPAVVRGHRASVPLAIGGLMIAPRCPARRPMDPYTVAHRDVRWPTVPIGEATRIPLLQEDDGLLGIHSQETGTCLLRRVSLDASRDAR